MGVLADLPTDNPESFENSRVVEFSGFIAWNRYAFLYMKIMF